MFFSQLSAVAIALPVLIVFSVFVKMAQGATYSVVPFLNKQALGTVAGIVGAGGNAGAVAAGFLFKGALDWPTALLILGGLVTACSFLAFAVRFNTEAEIESRVEYERATRPKTLRPTVEVDPASEREPVLNA